MYAHLEMKSEVPMVVTGFRLNSKRTFSYGDITIVTECVFPEGAPTGTISLSFYRDDKAAGLPGGESPEGVSELEFISKILPVKDIAYLLSLFGLHRPVDVYENQRRERVETPRARKFKFYNRVELLFSQKVEEAWLQTHGAMLGYIRTKK